MPEAPTASLPLGYRSSLDGLRAVAILMVVAYHEGLLKGGFLGVDLFFVLSGFLITSILLQEWSATGSIDLGKFYLRRILRLAPALCVFVAVMYATTHWVAPQLAETLRGTWAAAAVFYVSDLLIAYGRQYPLGHVSICWSLAIEEQFYLVWPLALRALLRAQLSRRAVAGLLILPIAASAALRSVIVARHLGEPDLWLRVYFAPDTRADTLLVGCLLGLLSPRLLPRAATLIVRASAIGSIGLVSYFAATQQIADMVGRPILFSIVSVAAALIVLEAVLGGWLGRALGWRPMVWLGQLSYSLYLWHGVGLELGVLGGPLGKAATLLALAMTSHYLVERPFLGLKDRFAPVLVPGRWLGTVTLFGGAAGSASPAAGAPRIALLGGVGIAALASITGLGFPWLIRSQPQLALQRVREGVERYPDDPRLLSSLAAALAGVGDWPGALGAYERALVLRPNDPGTLSASAVALRRVGRLAEATARFDRALALDPKLADAHLGLGEVALDQDRTADAIAAFSRALALAPDDARVHNELGVAYAAQGQIEKAIEHFSEAVRLNPRSPAVQNLERARGDLVRSLKAPATR